MDLLNKNIVVFSPEFFNVEKMILSELNRRGANVTWFDERPKLSSFQRALNVLVPYIFRFKSNRYYRKAFNSLNSVDVCLIVKGDQFFKKSIKLFRKLFPSSKLILYLWDPMQCCKTIKGRLPLYDKVVSFDSKDCKKYGFSFRPLFIDFDSKEVIETEKKVDVSFYGTIYGDRPNVLYKIEKDCERLGLSYQGFYYIRGKFMYVYYWIRNSFFRKLNKKFITYHGMNNEEIKSFISKSRTIVDVNEKVQSGLTMRTIESLSQNVKLFSTNDALEEYDFFDSSNIYLINRENPVLNKNFIYDDKNDISALVEKNFNIKGWVDNVFE